MTTNIRIIKPEEIKIETEAQKKKRIEEILKKEEIKEREIEKREHKIIANAMKGWTFTEKSIKDMRRLNRETRKTGKEHGAILCVDKKTNKIDLFNECIGTECQVYIKGNCPNGKEEVGRFHTHPSQNLARFSAVDIIPDHHFNCLGLPEAKKGEDLECLILKKKSIKKESFLRRADELHYYSLLEHKSSLKDATDLSIFKQHLLDRYKRIRGLGELIYDDYYESNPDKYIDP